MSWEAWGSGPEPFDVDKLYREGWDCDESCAVWFKEEEPEKVYTLDEAIQIYEDWLSNEE